MSNHHHTGIHDPEGNYPAFIEHFHKLFAKCQNALRGRWENFWSSEQTSFVRLVNPDDVLEKMTYALTNPVKDGLVEKAHHWPGATSFGSLMHGVVLTATRPTHFFREDGTMPTTVSLRISRPRELADLSDREFAVLMQERVREVEERAALERQRRGAFVVGRRAVLGQRWNDRPGNREPKRELNPRVASRNKWSRIEAVMRNRIFCAAYAAARDSFSKGVGEVLFPAGTYWLRRFACARCEPHPSPT